jgi:hypothetical protein
MATQLSRRIWGDGQETTPGRMLLGGAIIWAAYSAIHLLVNGVVLDEAVVPAQIIAGSVRYPAGHPHEIYHTQIFNLANYLAAGLWAVIPDALLLSGLRNFILLFLNAFLPFGFVIVLTRQPLWGHVAASLTVAQVGGAPFAGIYPISVFPTFYSTGQIGLQIALLSVLSLLGRFSKLAGLLFGLLPSVHGFYALPVWLWGGAHLVITRGRQSGLSKSRFAVAAAVGVMICLIVLGTIRLTASNVRGEPPYDVRGDDEVIYEQFTKNSDMLRQPLSPASLGYLVNPGAFFLLGGRLLWRARRQREIAGPAHQALVSLMLLGGMLWVYVYGTWLFQTLGGELPAFVQISMPARFSNITAMLLLPLTVAAIVYSQHDLPQRLALTARMLFIGMIPLTAIIAMAQSRFSPEPMFMLWGTLVATEVFAIRGEDRRRLLIVLMGIGVGMVLAQLGNTLFLTSFLLSAGILGLAARATRSRQPFPQHWHPWTARGLVVACLFASSASLLGSSEWMKIKLTQEDRELEAWLRANSASSDMILTPYNFMPVLQIKTGHPVLMEHETLWAMSYMPGLAPVLGMMSRELYGIDYSHAGSLDRLKSRDCSEFWVRLCKDAYFEAWRTRTGADWQSLARKYRFHFVFSPPEMPLQLPVARSWSSGWTLYVIPRDESEQEDLETSASRISVTR